MEFVRKLGEYTLTKDDVMRQVATEKFRQEVERAARAGSENSLAWHTLGVWTEDGKGRIGCFSRALAVMANEPMFHPPQSLKDQWVHEHSQADCLYEIGRVHAAEGSREVAQDFLVRALQHARLAENVREKAASPGETLDAQLEGKIAAALMMLDELE